LIFELGKKILQGEIKQEQLRPMGEKAPKEISWLSSLAKREFSFYFCLKDLKT
jgi:hypothetical protein